MDHEQAARQQVHAAQQRYRPPAGSRQILLVRHGSSIGETIETFQLGEITISNPPLSADGFAQAEALATHLGAEPIAGIFVTPLQRTHQTAAPLAERCGIDPVEIADLREVYLGDWEHCFYRQAAARHPIIAQIFADENWDAIPNAERSDDFARRVRRGIETIVAASAPDTTVISFSHAATIAEICHQATGSRPFAFMAPENSSVTRLVIGPDGGWKLRNFNDVTHLGYF